MYDSGVIADIVIVVVVILFPGVDNTIVVLTKRANNTSPFAFLGASPRSTSEFHLLRTGLQPWHVTADERRPQILQYYVLKLEA